MYTSTTTLLAAFDGEVSVDNHLHELRYLEDSRLLLEKKGDFKNLLADAGQAVLSSGAIAATGGAGGDVVVDVIFAAKTASRVLEAGPVPMDQGPPDPRSNGPRSAEKVISRFIFNGIVR